MLLYCGQVETGPLLPKNVYLVCFSHYKEIKKVNSV